MATSNQAQAAAYEKGKLYELSIIDLKPDPNQPRKSMDPLALEELAASIKTHGVIQPILFRIAADSPYLIIVAGERRYKEIGGHDAASCPPYSIIKHFLDSGFHRNDE